MCRVIRCCWLGSPAQRVSSLVHGRRTGPRNSAPNAVWKVRVQFGQEKFQKFTHIPRRQEGERYGTRRIFFADADLVWPHPAAAHLVCVVWRRSFDGEENKMGGQKFQYDESGGTFFYFILSFLALILIPATVYFWPRKKKEGRWSCWFPSSGTLGRGWVGGHDQGKRRRNEQLSFHLSLSHHFIHFFWVCDLELSYFLWTTSDLCCRACLAYVGVA